MDEIDERINEESEDQLEEAIPPEDIVAFNESRSCADLFRMFDKGQLDINPDFQRKIVWSNRDQTLFVDSLMKQLPIPSMCISLDVKTQKRVVIDGLQRMSTIIRFLDFGRKDWTLSRSDDVDHRISGRKVSDIAREFQNLYCAVENLSLPVTVLRCDFSKKSHVEYLFQIFRRLNSGGRRLLNQEIRNCIYHGRLNDYLRNVVRTDLWLEVMRVSKEQVETARYGNEERALRFFAMNAAWKDYNGRLSRFLNEYMRRNKDLSDESVAVLNETLRRVLIIVRSIEVPLPVIRNKNLMEGLMVGLAANVDFVESIDTNERKLRFSKMMSTNPYSVNVKEGMAHRDKVQERIKSAINAFRK